MLAIAFITRGPDRPGFLSSAPPYPSPLPITTRSPLSTDALTNALRLAQLYQISFPGQLDLLEQEIDLASEESLGEAIAQFL